MNSEVDKTLSLLSAALEKIADNVMIANAKGIIEYINPAFESTTGYSSQEVIGQTPRILRSGLNSAAYYENLWKTILSGQSFSAITPNKKKDGTIFYSDQTITPIKSKTGEIIYFISVWRDISDRVFLENEMKKLNQKLIYEQYKLEQVLSIEAVLHSISDQNHLIDFVVDKTCTVLEAGKCSIMFVDEQSSDLCMKGYKGLDESKIGQAPIKVGDQVEDLIELHRSGVVQNGGTDRHHGSLKIDGSVYQSDYFLSVPIQVGEHFIGIFNVSDKRSDHDKVFTELDIKILSMIVRQVKVAIDNAKLYKHLKDLTLTDALTGIHNYRYFIQTFDYEIARAKRYKRKLSLLMIDVDYFKSYNDTFGHLEGDKLLRTIAKNMKDNLREIDSVCRYAGDEFVVILPETDLSQAILITEKIRKQIGLLEFKKPVTLSIGVTQCDPEGNRHEHVHRADNALYAAKKQGRNQFFSTIRQQGFQV